MHYTMMYYKEMWYSNPIIVLHLSYEIRKKIVMGIQPSLIIWKGYMENFSIRNSENDI